MNKVTRRIRTAVWAIAAVTFGFGLWAIPSSVALACSLFVLSAVIGLLNVVAVSAATKAIVVAIDNDLDATRAQFKQVVENLPVGLFTFRNGMVGFSNWAWDEQCSRLPGTSPNEALKGTLSSNTQEPVLDLLKRYEQREEPFTMRLTIHDPWGSERHIESRGVPVYDADGNFLHLLGFNLDITSAELATRELNVRNLALETAFRDLEDNLEAMLSSLVKAIEAKDPYTAGHSERVMEYSVRIGTAMGLSKDDLHILRMGTLIHDIGKIGVPDSVLTKPDKLTNEEFEIIKRHPVTGFNMIRDIPYFKACAPIVRWHHERLNGKGYPDGLHGEEIPLLVQISTVADMFDAMTSNRAYRRSLGIEVAMAELRKDAAANVVNPDIVAIWETLLREDGVLREELTVDLPLAA